MKLSEYSKQSRQSRPRMLRLTTEAAYAKMDRLMGMTGTFSTQIGSG